MRSSERPNLVFGLNETVQILYMEKCDFLGIWIIPGSLKGFKYSQNDREGLLPEAAAYKSLFVPYFDYKTIVSVTR